MTLSATGVQHHRLRLILGIALAVPIPLIAVTLIAWTSEDFRHAPGWARDWMIYALPLLSIIGFAILPIRAWLRAVLGCAIVPMICLLLLFWTLVFVCYAFGDCMKPTLV